MKITSFDSDSVDVLSSDIESALADVAEKRGVQIKIGKITFRSNQCAVAVEVSTVSESGEVMTREAEDFKAAASFFGLTPEHLGKTFRDSHGLRFRLVGLNLKARKHPFIIADVTGKEYATTEAVILRGFGIESPKTTEASVKPPLSL